MLVEKLDEVSVELSEGGSALVSVFFLSLDVFFLGKVVFVLKLSVVQVVLCLED
jgi:hypothetical protein